LLGLYLLAVVVQNHVRDFAAAVFYELHLNADARHVEVGFGFGNQLGLVLAFGSAEEFVAIAADRQHAEGRVVLADVGVIDFRVNLGGRGVGGLLVVGGLGIAGLRVAGLAAFLVRGEPFDINGVSAAPLFLLDEPLAARVPRRTAFGGDVAEGAIFRAELARLGQERRIGE